MNKNGVRLEHKDGVKLGIGVGLGFEMVLNLELVSGIE